MNTFKDVDFLQIVPDTYGIGIEFLRKGEKYVSVCEHEKSRKVFLDITTWKSMQSDALHHYGELKVNGIRAQCLKTSKLFYIEGQFVRNG